MRKIFLGLTSVFLVLFNISSFAEKIVITGQPVAVTKQGEVYTVPANYTPSGDYYYITVDGTNKICYPQQQATLSSLTPTTLNVQMSGKEVKWTCYAYDETYFTVSP